MNSASTTHLPKSFNINSPLLNKTLSIQPLFYLVLILHIAIWTITPVLIRHTVSSDVIESFVWAQHLDWGYDKNPYLIGWITHLALWITNHNNPLGYYFIQQLLIGLGFWSIWKLGNALFNSPQKALVATLMYEGCLYFSVYAQTNNDNFPLIGLWALAAYTFYSACQRQYLRDWLITAITLGLAMMVKYSTAIFMCGLFLYLIIEKNARQSFLNPKFYIAIPVFLLPILPNIFWLFQHDLIALRYISFRKNVIESNYLYIKNLDYIGNFIQQTFSNFLGCLVLFALTAPRPAPKQQREKTITHYLWCIGIFPIASILLLAIVLGWRLYWEWGVPFIIFWGLILVHYLQPNTHRAAMLRFFIGVLLIMGVSLAGNIFITTYLKTGNGSADYPAQQIADYVTAIWKENYPNNRLAFVAGSRYTAGYVGFYSENKPKVFAEWNELFSPGVQENDVRKQGAIFVQDGNYGTPVLGLPEGYKTVEQFPTSIMEKYPQLIVLPLQTFRYHHGNDKAEAETVRLLVGILPPQMN